MRANAAPRGRAAVSPADTGAKKIEIGLILYVANSTPNSQRARANLDAALRELAVPTRYRLEIIDVLADAKRALNDSIIVTPTLVVLGPKRRLVMIGDLSDPGKLQGLLRTAAGLG